MPAADTSYYCRTFRAPEEQPHNIIAIENVFDNQNVLHHIILFACKVSNYPPHQFDRLKPCGLVNEFCSDMIYAWKIGVGDRCLAEDSGIPFGGEGYNTFVLQIHWNNPEMRSDYRDSSGVRIYYSPILRPHFEQVALFMQGTIDVPPLTENYTVTASCPGRCIRKSMYITTMFLHMHRLGQSGTVELYRNGTLYQTLVVEEDYSDTKPKFVTFTPALEVYPDDEVKVTCQFNSLSDTKRREHAVHGGYSASAEMCIAFTTYYPDQSPAFSCIQYGGSISPCEDTRRHTQYSVFPAEPIDIVEENDHDHHGVSILPNGREGEEHNGIQGFHMSERDRQMLILELFSEIEDEK